MSSKDLFLGYIKAYNAKDVTALLTSSRAARSSGSAITVE